MLTLLAQFAWRRSRWLLIAAGLALAAFGFWGFQAFPALISGGFDDPGAEATRAAQVIDAKFGGPDNIAIVVNAPSGSTVDDAVGQRVGVDVTKRVADTPGVTDVVSYFGTQAPSLRSTDGRQALIVAKAPGGDTQATATLEQLRDHVSGTTDATTVWVGGGAVTGDDIGGQVLTDLGRAEAIAVPITLLLLLFVFGSVMAALLPLAIGAFSVFGAFFAIFVITKFADVSIFSINLITGLGLGLAIDYSLLIVSRFREELGRTADQAQPRGTPAERERVRVALTTTMQTAGRTVLFTGLAVSLALLVLLVFPIPFLRSFGYGGVAVVVVSVLGALFVLPALLAALGTRVDAGRIRRGRPVRPASARSPFWYGLASGVLRRPWLALPVLALMALMAWPLTGATFGSPDERVLNTQAESRLVGNALRANFPGSTSSTPEALITGTPTVAALEAYVATISRLPHVDAAQSSAGIYVKGDQVAPAPSGLVAGNVSRVTVTGPKDAASTTAKAMVTDMRAVPVPAGTTVLVGGESAQLVDNQKALVDRLPLAAALIVATTLLLVFLFTGSVLLPIKAVLMNVVTLGAVIGAMTWIFQEGHLSGLLRFSKGPIDTSMPILLFCIAFGLSMDYELFLIARIKEFHDHGGSLQESVAGGLASTGRITTMAAAVLAVTFAAFGTSRVTFIQLFGIGTGLAILMDATLVRGILVPAFMRIAGPANWWAPRPLRALHRVIGLQEASPAPLPAGPAPVSPPGRRRAHTREDYRNARPRRALVE
ncbi:MAG TPA: MMPL family transporter [Propionibacteriaceae bacterium]